MELRLLRSFAVLAEELHFGRAAERLCIVQPALSMQIRALEESLGVVLFDRDRHRVELSQAGRIFLPEALTTLDQARRAVQVVQAAEHGEAGTIRLGFVSSVLPAHLPALIRALHAKHPLIRLELKDMSTPDPLAALQANAKTLQATRVQIVRGDALNFARSTAQPFDVVFVDPPYRAGWIDRIAPLLPKIFLTAE